MKIGVVGAGLVGSTSAYALVMRGIGREIVLVDKDPARAQAEAEHIFHAVPFSHPLNVTAGDFDDLAASRLVVIAAGVGQRPGETRLELLARNAEVFQQIIPKILSVAPDAILLVATNPVDVMTHLTARYARQFGLPSTKVIGSGTTLDTARFRALLGNHLGIDPQHVHAYVLGEHGDSEVLAWSSVTIAGLALEDYCAQVGKSLNQSDRDRIDKAVRRAAYNIIDGKGATYYGIGSAIARISEILLRDQRAALTVCTPLNDFLGFKKVTVAMPNLLGGTGVIQTLEQNLNQEEQVALQNSASVVHQALQDLN